ncbi:DUF4276 family protein [Pseudomonas monteilii]|nr:DUF4276 family protein [Pseudomonas monteilii]
MKINFVLIGEGSSDLRLVEHIESILVGEGFTEVNGEAPDFSVFKNKIGCSVGEKLQAIVSHYPSADVIFVHRDADRAGIDERVREIFEAIPNCIRHHKVIPVVPVTMLETWLLADAEAIKRVAGNRGYRGDLPNVPALRALENVRDPKALLLQTLCEVSGTTGARLTKFKKRFGEMRARLTFDLDPDGPVSDLESYKVFRREISEFAVSRIK